MIIQDDDADGHSGVYAQLHNMVLMMVVGMMLIITMMLTITMMMTEMYMSSYIRMFNNIEDNNEDDDENRGAYVQLHTMFTSMIIE